MVETVGRQEETGGSPCDESSEASAATGEAASGGCHTGERNDVYGLARGCVAARSCFLKSVDEGVAGSPCPLQAGGEGSGSADPPSEAEDRAQACRRCSASGGAPKSGRQRTRRRKKKDKGETRSEGQAEQRPGPGAENEPAESSTEVRQDPACRQNVASAHDEVGVSGKRERLPSDTKVRNREEKETTSGQKTDGTRSKASRGGPETPESREENDSKPVAATFTGEARMSAERQREQAVESSAGHSEIPCIRVLRDTDDAPIAQTGEHNDREADGGSPQPSSSGEDSRKVMDQDESDGERALASSSERGDSSDSVTGPPVRLVRAYSQYYKTKMCVYVVQGRACARDSKCVYAHSEGELREPPNLEKTRLCPVFKQTGACPNSDFCAYAHSAVELRHTVTVFKTKICHMWNKGKCGAGPACRHAHGLEELKRHRQRSQQELVALSRGSNLQGASSGSAGAQGGSCQSEEEATQAERGVASSSSASSGESGDAHSGTKDASNGRAKEDIETPEVEPIKDAVVPAVPLASAKGRSEKKPIQSDRVVAPTKERRITEGCRQAVAGTDGLGQQRIVTLEPEKSYVGFGAQTKGREDRKAQVAGGGSSKASSQRVREGVCEAQGRRMQLGRQHGDGLRGYVSDREVKTYHSSRDSGPALAPQKGRARNLSGCTGVSALEAPGREREIASESRRQPTLSPLEQVLASSELHLPWMPPPPGRSGPPMQMTEQAPTRQAHPPRVPWPVAAENGETWRETPEPVPAALTHYLSALLALQDPEFSNQKGQNPRGVEESVSGMRRRLSSMSLNQSVAPFSRAAAGGSAFQRATPRQEHRNFCDPLESVNLSLHHSSTAHQRQAEQGALLQLLLGCRAEDLAGGATHRMASGAESRTQQLHAPVYRETHSRTARGFSESRSPRNWLVRTEELESLHFSSSLASGRGMRKSSVPSFAFSNSTAAGLLELLSRSEAGGPGQPSLESRSSDAGAAFPLADGGFWGLRTDGAAGVLDSAARDEGEKHACAIPRLLMMKGDGELQDSVQYFLSTVAPRASGRSTQGSGLQDYPLQATRAAEVSGSQQGLSAMPQSTATSTDDRFCCGSAPPVGAYFPQPASVGGRRTVVAEHSPLPTGVTVPFPALPEGNGERSADTEATSWARQGNWH
ncbi:UNVERIFIED_CONTAM: zinc finger (CCCH type) motif-containing protein [Hammondia hammondi]|eukprot:XP_008886816.1 zinc finger (CCCH type) motif-containing protein [Hammondia hammondi]